MDHVRNGFLLLQGGHCYMYKGPGAPRVSSVFIPSIVNRLQYGYIHKVKPTGSIERISGITYSSKILISPQGDPQ